MTAFDFLKTHPDAFAGSVVGVSLGSGNVHANLTYWHDGPSDFFCVNFVEPSSEERYLSLPDFKEKYSHAVLD